MRIIAIAVLVSLTLAGCSQVDETPESVLEADVGQGVIRGLVVDSAITPLAGVAIDLLHHNVTGYTDADGVFGFSNVDGGVYRLRATMSGYTAKEVTVTVVPDDLEPELVQVDLVRIPGTEPMAVSAKHDAWISCEVLLTYIQESCATNVPVFTPNDNRIRLAVDERVPAAVHVELGWTPNQDTGTRLTLNYGSCDQQSYCDPLPPSDTFMCQTWGPSPLWCRVTHTGAERSGEGTAYRNLIDAKLGAKPPSSVAIHIGADCAECAPAPYEDYGVGVVVEQGVEAFLWTFYNFEPEDGWAFLVDGDPVVPA